MQNLKIYIVIEDPKTKQDVSIRGNLDILRSFLAGVGTLEIHEQPADLPPVNLSPLPQTAEGAAA
jgi:hypothetical protein